MKKTIKKIMETKMDKQKLNMLLQLRKWVIEQHNALDGAGNPQSLCKQTDVAEMLSSVIKSIDDIVKDDVTFG